jgi:hypothetical protein
MLIAGRIYLFFAARLIPAGSEFWQHVAKSFSGNMKLVEWPRFAHKKIESFKQCFETWGIMVDLFFVFLCRLQDTLLLTAN